MLRYENWKLIDKELDEAYDFGYLSGYAWWDDTRGWDVYKTYEKISRDFSLLQHLLNELSDLETEQKEHVRHDLEPNVYRGPSATCKGKWAAEESWF